MKLNKNVKYIIDSLDCEFNEVSIAIAGDFGIDRFIHGSVSRISQEAPVPILLKQSEKIVLGMAGNVASNIHSLNNKFPNKISLFGVHGCDKYGWMMNEMLQDTADSIYISTENENRKTTIKTRYISNNQQLIRVDDEDNYNIDKFEEVTAINWFKDLSPTLDVLIIQDYNKGFLTDNLTREFIKIANENNILIVTDPNSNANPYKYQNSTIITPNVNEAREMLKKLNFYNKYTKVDHMAQYLSVVLNVKNVLITEASDGMTLLDENREIHKFPALCKNVKDITGAGDTVTSTIALALANGYSVVESCWLATGAASVVVGKQGTSIASIEEIKKELQNYE
jgi:rfaE bifunctional protein kinase chain/domain